MKETEGSGTCLPCPQSSCSQALGWRRSAIAPQRTPQQQCSCQRVNKPAPAAPVLSALHLHHENVVAGEMKQKVCVVFPPYWKGGQNHVLLLFTSCLAFYFLWCQRERLERFDFVVQVLGHLLGLGSPGSLTWWPQDLVQEPLNKYRQSLEHRDKALGSPYCFPTHSQEPLAGCRVWLPLVLSPFNEFF